MDLSQLNRRRRRSAEDHLYFFTGVDNQYVQAWFEDIELVSRMIGATESMVMTQAVGLLIDEAERWYQQHQNILTNWSDFKHHMIARFHTRPKSIDTNVQLTTNTLMPACHRNIVWYPQHIADYQSYYNNNNISRTTDRPLPLPCPQPDRYIPNPFEDVWLDGAESWNDTVVKSQRPIIAMN